jgi:hypothetical protein
LARAFAGLTLVLAIVQTAVPLVEVTLKPTAALQPWAVGLRSTLKGVSLHAETPFAIAALSSATAFAGSTEPGGVPAFPIGS